MVEQTSNIKNQKMGFGRKFWLGFWLGMSFMAVSLVLTYTAMTVSPQVPLVGLATVIGAIAVGVGSIMGTMIWGNVKEHQAATPPSVQTPTVSPP